jgi:polysaccharide deacetylase family protein (PEP-CTERM system associated)
MRKLHIPAAARQSSRPVGGSASVCNAFTVDVEDYYHVSAFEHAIPRSEWGGLESRIVASTDRLLALLRAHAVSGTFFVLGWVAERFPSLVKQIAAAGHEIGTHSYWHRLIYTLEPGEFRDDLRRSRDVLEDILGRKVVAFRAPSFSIVRSSLWALQILAEEGFEIDSSIYPVVHDRYGIHNARVDPHFWEFDGGRLLEFPPSVFGIAGLRLPVGGGGYFRLYPRSVTLRAIRAANRRGRPFMFYIHPWELDPEQPRMRGVGWKSRARHYVNLARTESRLNWLLDRVRFGSISEALAHSAAPREKHHGSTWNSLAASQ